MRAAEHPYCIHCGYDVISVNGEIVDTEIESPFCRQAFDGLHDMNAQDIFVEDDNEY